MSRLAELLPELQARPGMFLPDGNYATLVAFIEGLAMGAADSSIEGFADWLAEQTSGAPDARHWANIVASQVTPRLGNGREPLSAMTEEEQARAREELLRRLAEYLSSRR